MKRWKAGTEHLTLPWTHMARVVVELLQSVGLLTSGQLWSEWVAILWGDCEVVGTTIENKVAESAVQGEWPWSQTPPKGWWAEWPPLARTRQKPSILHLLASPWLERWWWFHEWETSSTVLMLLNWQRWPGLRTLLLYPSIHREPGTDCLLDNGLYTRRCTVDTWLQLRKTSFAFHLSTVEGIAGVPTYYFHDNGKGWSIPMEGSPFDRPLLFLSIPNTAYCWSTGTAHMTVMKPLSCFNLLWTD